MLSRSAFAQGEPAPAPITLEPAPARPPPPARSFPNAQPHDEGGGARSAWRERYEAAREELIQGYFAAARAHFTDLVATAENDVDRAIAQEDADLAGEWQRRDLAFVRRIDLGESHLTPKALDRRTGDELVSLYANGVVWGVGTGAWLDIVATYNQKDASSGVIIGLPVAMIGLTEVGIALADTQAHALRYGGAQSIVSGLYIGFEEGLIWTIYSENLRTRSSQMTPPVAATFIWGTSTAGAVAGGLVGAFHPTTPGRASFVGSTSLWSAVIVGSVVGAVQPARTIGGGSTDTSTPFFAAGVALNAGLVGGLLLAEPVSPMVARVRLLDLGGATGYLVGAGIYAAAASNRGTGQGAVGFGALGSALGLAGMWFATAAMDDDRREVHKAAPTSALDSITPTILPVDRGAAIGIRGLLF